MRKKQSALIVLLSAMLLCTSCGQSAGQTPELLEPAEIMAACRPVERGNIGNVQFLLATVVPMEYCSCFDSSVTVEQIYVSVGDEVKKGDVLAKADTASAKQQLDGLNRQLRQEKEIYALNHKVAQLTADDLKKRIKEARSRKTQNMDETEETEQQEETEQEPEESEESLRIQLAEHEENTAYDTKLYNYRISKLALSIREKERIVKEGTLKAAHGGKVTCIKNLMVSREAFAGEVIVSYSSDEATYLEVQDTTVDAYKFQDYQKKYILAGGVEYDVEEITYSTQEMILAKINSRFPNLRFACPKNASLKTGDTYPVCFVKERVNDVLLTGNDSLYEDGSTTYVYVKDGDSRIRREVTTGLSDQYYTEIKEGLSEGELVYYESSVALPGDYKPYTVSPGDYNSMNCAISYQKSDLDNRLYKSEYDGVIQKMAVEKDSQVKKGDLLYVVATGAGMAAIVEAKNAVEQENLSYQKAMKEFALQEKELEDNSMEKQILSCRKQIAKLQHENALYDLQEAYNQISKNNDGKGNIYVYAEEDGTVLEVFLQEEDKLLAGNEVLTVTTNESDLLLLQMKPSRDKQIPVNTDRIAEVGEELVYNKDKQKGTCVGYAVGNNMNKTYLYSDADGAHLGYYTSSGYEFPAFYVRMENADFIKDMTGGGYFMFDEYSMHDVIVIPSDMVKTEEDAINADKVWNYVWRVADGEIIKQYVLVDERLSNMQQTVVLSGLKTGDILAKE